MSNTDAQWRLSRTQRELLNILIHGAQLVWMPSTANALTGAYFLRGSTTPAPNVNTIRAMEARGYLQKVPPNYGDYGVHFALTPQGREAHDRARGSYT